MSNTPQIRFAGFTDAWEQRKLGEISESFEYGLNAAATEYDGKHKYIRITDIDDSTHLFIQDNLTSPDIDFSTADDYLLQAGDVLFARTGASVGKTYIYRSSDGDLYFAGFLIRAKIKRDYDADFVFQNTLTDNYDSYIRITSQRSGQPGVNAQEYANFALSVPCLAEQKKIGAYFTNLDNLITLHQRECDALQKFKKSMLQKMFPQNGESVPEIRFAGFTDAWEQRKLGDIVTVYDGVHQTPNYQTSGVMFLSVENIATLKSNKFISFEDFKRDYKVYPQRNDILMTRIGDVGTTNVVTDNDVKAYYVSLALLKYKETNPFFLSSAIQSDFVQKGLSNRTLKTAIPMKINKDEIGQVDVMLPTSADEQDKIGSFFSQLDTLITLHQRKLETLQKMKKSLLQKMFV